jgi:predicted permease
MSWLIARSGEITRRIRTLLHRDQVARELAEEFQLHLDLRTQQQTAQGSNPNDAQAAARRRFGNPTRLREQSYEAWGWRWLETLFQDAQYGLRGMLRSPGITLVALLSLALGIGANTALFSLIDAVMLRSLPVDHPEQLVLLGTAGERGTVSGFDVTDLFSYPFYQLFQQRNRSFISTAAMVSGDRAVHGFIDGRREAVPMQVGLVSGSYFSTLGVSTIIGRPLGDNDNRVEEPQPVAVISDSWWKRAYAHDPAILGRRIKIDATTFTIIGVTPPEFFGVEVGEAPDLWLPLAFMPAVPPHRTCLKEDLEQCLFIFGRLRPGVSITQGASEVNFLRQQLLPGFPDAHLSPEDWKDLKGSHIPLTSMSGGFSGLRRQYSGPLRVLIAIAGLVLLIACTNLANLLLARSTVRARELAIRQAMGANRARIIRQLLVESLLLAGAGGLLGIAVAQLAAPLLLRMVSDGRDVLSLNLALNSRLLLFSLALTFATTLLFGIVPALRASRPDLVSSLKEKQSRIGAGSGTLLARSLIVSQLVFSIILVAAAGLFLRSLVNLANSETGFNPQNVLRLNLDLGSAGYLENDPRLALLYREVEGRVAALPGVRAASLSTFTFHEGSWSGPVSVPRADSQVKISADHNVVGNDYFRTMQIPLIAGRLFGSQDSASSPKVAVVSQQIARTLFPKDSAIGRHYRIADSSPEDDREIIGVVGDVKFEGVDEPPTPIDYFPYQQNPRYLHDLEVRYTGDDGAIAAAVQHAIHQTNPNLPIYRVTTLEEQVARSYTNHRVTAQLSAFFGLLAATLSAIGIYGLMSYMVSRRTSEIGIRMALGAERLHISWLVMREIVTLVAIGIAVGVPVALLANHTIVSMLFGVTASDPISLLATIAILVVIAAVAGYLPARRAARVEPIVALRCE